MNKTTLKIFYLISFVFLLLVSCDDQTSDELSESDMKNFEITYRLDKVMQFDPLNTDGIDIAKKLKFFYTLEFKLRYNDGVLTYLSYNNGKVPFTPFSFETDSEIGAECEIDYDVEPNELRRKGTDEVIAYYNEGEFTMPFELDCDVVSYKYIFTQNYALPL